MKKRWLMRYCLATSLALASVRSESAASRHFCTTSFSFGSGASVSGVGVSWVLTNRMCTVTHGPCAVSQMCLKTNLSCTQSS